LTILSNTLALIVVLSVLVVVHEFGHFAVAKWFRFPVEVFSVGFGKRLFGKKWHGTDYRVSAIPLGGYVRVIGLGPDESTVTEGTSQEAPPVGKRWQRALVLLAGPTMNLVLALLLHTAVFAVGTRVPAYELEQPVVRVVEEGSPGAAAGFQPGDRIVSINGTETPRWRDVLFLFGMNAREKLSVEVERGSSGVFLDVTPKPSTKYDLGYVGLLPDFGTSVRARIAAVVGNSPAQKAGLKAGDIVVAVAGKPIQGAPDQVHEVRRGGRLSRPGPSRSSTCATERRGRRPSRPERTRTGRGRWASRSPATCPRWSSVSPCARLSRRGGGAWRRISR
jgi:regulator of sigma E protease